MSIWAFVGILVTVTIIMVAGGIKLGGIIQDKEDELMGKSKSKVKKKNRRQLAAAVANGTEPRRKKRKSV